MFGHSFNHHLILAILFIFMIVGCDFETPFANDAVVSEIGTSFKSGDTTYEVDATGITATMPDANTITLFGKNRQNPFATVTLHTETPTPPPPTASNKYFRIIPGVGLEYKTASMAKPVKISLGDSIADLKLKYSTIEPKTVGWSDDAIVFFSLDFNYIITYQADNKVDTIVVQTPPWKLSNGISVGSLQTELKNHYGEPFDITTEGAGYNTVRLRYPAHGILFGVNIRGVNNIRYIMIYKRKN